MTDKTETRGSIDLIELIVAILLGVTAVLTAWGAWQSSLYGGQQATKYTQGTAAVAQGNSMYTEARADLTADEALFSEYWGLWVDQSFAEDSGKTADAARISYKMTAVENRMTEELATRVKAFVEEEEAPLPFDDEAWVDSYFEDAEAKIAEGEAKIEAGSVDNHLGDVLNMATVIFAVALFLLGICSTFKGRAVRLGLITLSVIAIGVGTWFMCTIPVITDF